MSSGRILIADDEPSVRDSVGYALAQEGFEVTPVADGDEATEKLGDGDPLRPADPRHHDAGAERPRHLPRRALAQRRADHRPHRQGRRGRQGRRARGRRRRLRHQALLGARAARPRAGPAPPPRARPLAAWPRRCRIEAGPVAIDLVRHVATVRGEPVNLTRSEFQLLRLMVGRPGRGLPPPPDHGGALADRVRRRRACL